MVRFHVDIKSQQSEKKGNIMEKEYWVDDGTELGIACPCCGKSFNYYIHATEYVSLIEIPNYCPNCGKKLENKWNDLN